MIEGEIKECIEGEAIVDICLAVAAIRNTSLNWTPSFTVEIGFYLSDYPERPSPYQVLQGATSSSITLYTYRTSQIVLHPHQNKSIDNICTFRTHVPILCLEEGQLACEVDIQVDGQSVGHQVIQYDTLMSLNAFLPAYDMGVGISIQAMVETQLIGFRFCNKKEYSRVTLYKMIDILVLEHNRLVGKLDALKRNLSQSQVQPEMKILDERINILADMSSISHIDQSEEEKAFENKFENPFLIENLSAYPELSEIRKKTTNKIFNNGPSARNRSELKEFSSNFIPRTSATLQLSWGNYLRKIHELKLVRENVLNLRKRFFRELAYEIKQRVLKKNREDKINESVSSMASSKFESSMAYTGKDMDLGESDELYLKNKYIVSNSVLIDFGGMEIFHQISSKAMSSEQSFIQRRNSRQCVVLVHGYGANPVAMMMLERILTYIYPHLDILNSKSNQSPNELKRIEDMGRGLAAEIQLYLQSKERPEDVEISFFCHSLGGLIARAALVHLERYKFSMNLFVSLSCPHLGHLYHSNRLAKLGMVAISSIKHPKVIDCLLLKDGGESNNLRNSSVYSLSMHQGLSWFKTVHLYGSKNDGYVSLVSALVEQKKGLKGEKGEIMREMVKNLQESLRQVSTISRFDVKFTEQAIPDPPFSQYLLGRSSHLGFLNFPKFVNCVAVNCYKSLRKFEDQEI